MERGLLMKIKSSSKFGLRLRTDRVKNFDVIENQRFSKVQIPEIWNLRGI